MPVGVTWGRGTTRGFLFPQATRLWRARNRRVRQWERRTGRKYRGTAGFVSAMFGTSGIGAIFNPILRQVAWVGRAIATVATPVVRGAVAVVKLAKTAIDYAYPVLAIVGVAYGIYAWYHPWSVVGHAVGSSPAGAAYRAVAGGLRLFGNAYGGAVVDPAGLMRAASPAGF